MLLYVLKTKALLQTSDKHFVATPHPRLLQCVCRLATVAAEDSTMFGQSKSTTSAAAGQDRASSQLSLSDLPEAVLTHIAHLCKFKPPREFSTGHSMLQVSKACRDAVLHSLTKITLDPSSKELRPLARLLHRACCHAPTGLHVVLELYRHDNILPIIIQGGIGCRGWSRVHILEVGSEGDGLGSNRGYYTKGAYTGCQCVFAGSVQPTVAKPCSPTLLAPKQHGM
jgi:hypothetical protein